MNRQLAFVDLMALVVGLRACLVARADDSDSFKANMAIIVANADSEPVGNEATAAALRAVHDELAAIPKDQIDFAKSAILAYIGEINKACSADKATCAENLAIAKWLIEGEQPHTANLFPYLQECQRRQEELCAA